MPLASANSSRSAFKFELEAAEEGVELELEVEAAEVEAMAEMLLRPWAAVAAGVPSCNSVRDLANIRT